MALGFKATISAGIFTGALTNTPALAQVISYVANTAPPAVAAVAATEPVVGYSVSYPMGVIGPMLAIALVRSLWKVDYRADAQRVRDMFPVEQEIYNRTVQITNVALHRRGPARPGPTPALEGDLRAHATGRRHGSGHRRHGPGAG